MPGLPELASKSPEEEFTENQQRAQKGIERWLELG
jgi:hypothetical protein